MAKPNRMQAETEYQVWRRDPDGSSELVTPHGTAGKPAATRLRNDLNSGADDGVTYHVVKQVTTYTLVGK